MIRIYITQYPLETFYAEPISYDGYGACVEFTGAIRPEENGARIKGIEFEAYSSMAEKVMRKKLEKLQQKHEFLAAEVVHRYGKIHTGEVAIRVRIWSAHRKQAYDANAEFMDELKRDVPIWKVATY